MSLPAPDPDSQRIAAWTLARALEQGDTITAVLWLASQLGKIDRGHLVKLDVVDQKED